MFYVSIAVGCGVCLSAFLYKNAMKNDEMGRVVSERSLRDLAANDKSIYR